MEPVSLFEYTKNRLPIARVEDYEFQGIYRPKDEDEVYFFVYDILLDNGIEGRVFYPSTYGDVLLKGDVVEYAESGKGKLVVKHPKRYKTNITKK